jgi:hypothetical protein
VASKIFELLGISYVMTLGRRKKLLFEQRQRMERCVLWTSLLVKCKTDYTQIRSWIRYANVFLSRPVYELQ